MADIARKTKQYPTDLTDEEWVRIEPLLPKPSKRGRKIGGDLRLPAWCMDRLVGAEKLGRAEDRLFS